MYIVDLNGKNIRIEKFVVEKAFVKNVNDFSPGKMPQIDTENIENSRRYQCLPFPMSRTVFVQFLYNFLENFRTKNSSE